MIRPIRAIALILCAGLLLAAAAQAESLGPARSYDELLRLAASAADGDVILISGEIAAAQDTPLTSASAIRIRSSDEGHAVIDALRLRDALVTFDDIDLLDSLTIEGRSVVELTGGVTVTGAAGREGIRFSGSGTLLLDSGSLVIGGSGSAGLAISHESGDFYGHLDGTVRGGNGSTGGVGVEVSPLQQSGALMVSGTIAGGDGSSIGGHALNLYALSGNAFITLDGVLRGGSGHIGGNGVQIVSAADSVVVGVGGRIYGGQGETYGGNSLMLMNVGGGASINLTGALLGGDATDAAATPGASLLLVGDTTSAHTFVSGCLFEEGRLLAAQTSVAEPAVTPLPEIVASVDHATLLPQTSPSETGDELPEAGEEDEPLEPEDGATHEALPEQTLPPEPAPAESFDAPQA